MEQKSNLERLTTAVVYDVLTFDLRYPGQFMLSNEIRMMTGGRICGPAFTVQGRYTPNRMADYEEQAVVISMLEHMRPGVIELLQPNYAGPLGSWGDFTATLVRQHGCAGAVVDGFTRDMRGLREMNFSLYCKGTSLVNGFGSGWQIVEYQTPIDMPGPLGMPVRVNPGDYVLGDEDAVVVIPASLLDDVAEKGARRLDREADRKEMLARDALKAADLKKTIFDW
jgi:regulator of RNase E activity RraA